MFFQVFFVFGDGCEMGVGFAGGCGCCCVVVGVVVEFFGLGFGCCFGDLLLARFVFCMCFFWQAFFVVFCVCYVVAVFCCCW